MRAPPPPGKNKFLKYQGQEGREFSGSEIFYRNLERDSGKRKISRRYTGFDHFSESGIRQIFARDAILGYQDAGFS